MAKMTRDQLKAAADASFARWSSKNPGKSRADWQAENRAKVSAMAARYREKNPAAQAKYEERQKASAERKQAADTRLSASAGFKKWSAKNNGSVADYRSYLRTSMKEQADKAYAKWQSSNPGGTRADFSAYNRQRLKDFSARSRSRKLSG